MTERLTDLIARKQSLERQIDSARNKDCDDLEQELAGIDMLIQSYKHGRSRVTDDPETEAYKEDLADYLGGIDE